MAETETVETVDMCTWELSHMFFFILNRKEKWERYIYKGFLKGYKQILLRKKEITLPLHYLFVMQVNVLHNAYTVRTCKQFERYFRVL